MSLPDQKEFDRAIGIVLSEINEQSRLPVELKDLSEALLNLVHARECVDFEREEEELF